MHVSDQETQIEKEKEEVKTATFKARVQRLRRVVIKKKIAEELDIKRGDIVEITIRKVRPEELEFKV